MDALLKRSRLSPRGALMTAAVVVRGALLVLSSLSDRVWDGVRYTDVDYDVFTDGAREVAAGRSPYDRATYRYPPLLAWLLLPNLLLPEWGKLLFCGADLAVAWLLYSLLTRAQGLPPRAAAGYVAVFALHPFVVNVSTRGNADGLVALAVVACVHSLWAGRDAAAAVCLGLAAHLKLYPIIYALPVGLWLADPGLHAQREGGVAGGATGAPGTISAAALGVPTRWLRTRRLRPLLRFAAVAGGTLAALTGGSYAAYGPPFLHHAVTYHAGRSDPRHNFSPYFLPMYYDALGAAEVEGDNAGYAAGAGQATLQGNAATPHAAAAPAATWASEWIARAATPLIGNTGAAALGAAAGHGAALASAALASPLAAFLPQLGLVAVLGAAFAADLPFALWAQTAAFVGWNKVLTAQYFVWHLALLPLALPRSALGWRALSGLHAAWLAAELGWNWPALHLELRSQSVHAWAWAGSVGLLAVTAAVLAALVAGHRPQPMLGDAAVAAAEADARPAERKARAR